MQHLVRNRLFSVVVSLATEEWTWQDLLCGIAGPNPERKEYLFHEIVTSLMDSMPERSGKVQRSELLCV